MPRNHRLASVGIRKLLAIGTTALAGWLAFTLTEFALRPVERLWGGDTEQLRLVLPRVGSPPSCCIEPHVLQPRLASDGPRACAATADELLPLRFRQVEDQCLA